MAQPRRESRTGIPTQPYIMPDERRATGRSPAPRVPKRAGGRPPGARRASPPRRGLRSRPRHRPGRMGRARGAPSGRRRPHIDSRRWRAFAVLVIVPVLLMLGSIYTHAAADGLSGKVAEMDQRREMAEVRQENLDLRLTGLTAPERVRAEARELGLRDPVGNLKVYGSQGEDGTDAAGQTGEEEGR